MRQIILDTETTGLEPSQGHKIIEIGCVEMIDRKLTGNHFHVYLNPKREIDEGAIEVHGITNEFLEDKPLFKDVIDDFLEYVKGAELVIHNAPFDIGFLDWEIKSLNRNLGKMSDYCSILDTLVLARQMHPGQKNNLDALCKRYFIDNSHRDLHGALLDSEILADVYLGMTGGQTDLTLTHKQDYLTSSRDKEGIRRLAVDREPFKVIRSTQEELTEHQKYLQQIADSNGGKVIWN